jgi:hypothetical protein
VVPKEKVLERIDTLREIYLSPSLNYRGAHLDLYLLRHAVESYFLDLHRMKNFHGIEYADQHKCAAFTMFWIVKVHPVQIDKDVDMSCALILVNEMFAIHAGLAHLQLTPRKLTPNYIKNLMYTLHFRQVTPEIMASSMYLLECAHKNKTP